MARVLARPLISDSRGCCLNAVPSQILPSPSLALLRLASSRMVRGERFPLLDQDTGLIAPVGSLASLRSALPWGWPA